MMTNEQTQIKELRHKIDEIPFGSREYVNCLKELARLYYKYQNYKFACEQFIIFEKKCPDNDSGRINLFIATCRLHTNPDNYFKNPKRYFFKRLNKDDSSELLERRQAVFKEALNIFCRKYSEKQIEVNIDDFFEQAKLLNLASCEEWETFVKTACPIERCSDFLLPSVCTDYSEDLKSQNERLCKENAELKEKIESLEKQLCQLQYEERSSLKEDISENSDDKKVLSNKKILIIGYMKSNIKRPLLGKAKNHFGCTDIDVWDDYKKLKKQTSKIRPYASAYDAIILGEMPHQTTGTDDYSSFIEKIKKEEGYPYAVEAREKNRNLKITISSAMEAFADIENHFKLVLS